MKEKIDIGSTSNLQIYIFFILITGLLDIVLILLVEILPWSQTGVKNSATLPPKARKYFVVTSFSTAPMSNRSHLNKNLPRYPFLPCPPVPQE